MVSLEVDVPDAWFEMLVRIAQELRDRGTEVTPELVMPALLKLGLRAAAVEACGLAAGSFDFAQLTPTEWDQLDSALAKLILHGAGAPS